VDAHHFVTLKFLGQMRRYVAMVSLDAHHKMKLLSHQTVICERLLGFSDPHNFVELKFVHQLRLFGIQVSLRTGKQFE
jgi:hypothetical protein